MSTEKDTYYEWILDQFPQFLLVHVQSSTFCTYLLLDIALVLFNAFAVLGGFGVDDILSEQSQDSVLVVFVLSTITPLIDHFFPHLTTRWTQI